MSLKHRLFKKNFETEIYVNSIKLPLNHFVQEALANMIVGFSKTLKQVEGELPTRIEIKIKKLQSEVEVDAHTYP